MYSIARIEELIEIAEKTLSKYESELAANPNSLFLKGTIKNTNERLSELRGNLSFEKRIREVEVIDLRMMGSVAKLGRLPLDLLGVFAKVLSDTLVEAGKHYQFGNKSGKKYQDLTKKAINLKFERLVPGSTRILVTGSTNPDLFGNSILENALGNTFNALNVNAPQDLIETSEKLGSGSIKKLESLLELTSKNDLELELEWKAPNNKVFKWEGNKERISALTNTLASVQINPPQKMEIEGLLIMQSLKGQMDIKTDAKKIIRILFANNMLEDVKKIHIGDECKCFITYSIATNKITGDERYTYYLDSITSI